MEIKKERNDKRKSKGGGNGRKEKDRNACSCCTDWQYESISFTEKSSIIKQRVAQRCSILSDSHNLRNASSFMCILGKVKTQTKLVEETTENLPTEPESVVRCHFAWCLWMVHADRALNMYIISLLTLTLELVIVIQKGKHGEGGKQRIKEIIKKFEHEFAIKKDVIC